MKCYVFMLQQTYSSINNIIKRDYCTTTAILPCRKLYSLYLLNILSVSAASQLCRLNLNQAWYVAITGLVCGKLHLQPSTLWIAPIQYRVNFPYCWVIMQYITFTIYVLFSFLNLSKGTVTIRQPHFSIADFYANI